MPVGGAEGNIVDYEDQEGAVLEDPDDPQGEGEEYGQVYIENEDIRMEEPEFEYEERLEKMANYSDQGQAGGDDNLFAHEKIDFEALIQQKREERLAKEALENEVNIDDLNNQLAIDEANRIENELAQKQEEFEARQQEEAQYEGDEGEYAQIEPEDGHLELGRDTDDGQPVQVVENLDIEVPEIDPNAVNLEENEPRDSHLAEGMEGEEEAFMQEGEGEEEELNEEML